MKVYVRYFASLRERAGREGEWIEAEPGETLGGLYARLFPPTREGALPVAFARNREYARGTDEIAEGDEIVFLPPIGGG